MSTRVVLVQVHQPARSDSGVAPTVSWRAASNLEPWRQLAAEISWDDGSCVTNFQLDGNLADKVEWPFTHVPTQRGGRLRVRVQGVDGWSPWSDPQDVHVGDSNTLTQETEATR